MTLGNHDIVELTRLRRDLHRVPDLSGDEQATSDMIVQALQGCGPDRVLTGLGGAGCAAVFDGREPGPTVMIRCELDGLPIEETSDLPYRSTTQGRGHLCGHDGHMAMVMGVARMLGRARPARGRVVLLFQPAEETGAGAQTVIDDPQYAGIAPDYAFALHNLPGLALGQVMVGVGAMNCASRGMRVVLGGKTSHASAPEDGVSPMQTLSRLMPALTGLGPGGPMVEDFALVTVTHAAMGTPAFGIAPGEAELWATLRCVTDARMADLVAEAERLVQAEAAAEGLTVGIDYHDVFAACTNDAEAAAILAGAAQAIGVAPLPMPAPMRWSEDFGRYGQAGAKAAMFLLGAGADHPQLHNPDYDFPDDLIPIGTGVFVQAVRGLLGAE